MPYQINRRQFLKGAAAAALFSATPQWRLFGQTGSTASRPNFVIIFCDDMGYGDIACQGASGYSTPNIDRMAREGVRFTDFHAATAVCLASRAALLTGCYPERVGILGALGPASSVGISDSELTIAEMLKAEGYATSIYGKWHLGDAPRFLPTRHGFDEYFGLPYSNDMWPNHPTNGADYPPLPLYENEKVIEFNPDQRQLTTWYTQHAVDFIVRNRERPFFLYLPHSMPHVPLFVSDKYSGTTKRGLFGDVISEIDWSVGEILEALRKNGLEENTLVIFTSDNGPWLSYGEHAGSAGPFREGKGTLFEGGMREPCVMRWPGHIPAGTVCSELATTMDILPTLAALAGGKLPEHRIDGHDIRPLAEGQPGAVSPTEAYYCYWLGELHAVRSGKWKLHFPHDYRTLGGRPGGKGGQPAIYEKARTGKELYDLENDLGETRDVAAENPDVIRRLETLAEKARLDLGDKLTGIKGSGLRAPGRIE